MKNSFFASLLLAACVLGSCNKATTTSNTTFPTYKYSFTGRISNPKNITIPDDAYLSVMWLVESSGYKYYYGEGYIDKSTNTFTFGFNNDLPIDATNHIKLSDSPQLGIGYIVLLTSPSKYLGKDTTKYGDFPPGFKLWGAINWSGIIYIKGDLSGLSDDFAWPKKFNQGYTYGVGVETGRTFEEFTPAAPNNMVLLIDTTLKAFTFPNWTGKNPDKNPIK